MSNPITTAHRLRLTAATLSRVFAAATRELAGAIQDNEQLESSIRGLKLEGRVLGLAWLISRLGYASLLWLAYTLYQASAPELDDTSWLADTFSGREALFAVLAATLVVPLGLGLAAMALKFTYNVLYALCRPRLPRVFEPLIYPLILSLGCWLLWQQHALVHEYAHLARQEAGAMIAKAKAPAVTFDASR